MLQNWNNILNHIKYQHGVPYNMLELSDNDIIQFIKDVVIPEYSQFNPHKLWIKINETHQITSNEMFHEQVYKIDVPDEIYIIAIENVYWSMGSSFSEDNISHMFIDPVDIVLSNAYADLRESLSPVQHFEFLPPRTVSFGHSISNGVIAELNTVHTKLETIAPDLYNSLFKKMCLSSVCKYLIAIRSKFSNLTTPFGEVQLNVDRLNQLASDMDAQIKELQDNTPPNQLLAWF